MKRNNLIETFILICTITIILSSCDINNRNRQIVSSIDRSIPQPVGFVNDFEDIYSKSEEIALDSVIRDYNKRADIQIALATFDTNMVKKDSFQAYTLKVAQQWGVGEKVKNNGVFIGICKEHRIMYIQNGIGTAKILSDAATKSIVDTAFVPEFKKGNVYTGTLKGLYAIMVTISDRKD